MMRPLKHAHHKVRLSRQFYADIAWWVNFMAVFNGRCLTLQNAPLHEMYLDASNGEAGYVFDTDSGYTNWQNDLPSAALLHINDKEILSAILAARRWAPLWANFTSVVSHRQHHCPSCSSQGFCQVPSHYAAVAWTLLAICHFEFSYRCLLYSWLIKWYAWLHIAP